MTIFRILMPCTYWLLAAIWLTILVFCMKRLLIPKGQSKLFATLMFVLAIEAFRTFFESAYFGVMRTAQVGMLPNQIYEFLVQPQQTILPKFFNLIAGIIILILLLRRFVPQEIEFWEDQRKRIEQLEDSIDEARRAEAILRDSEEGYALMIRQTGQMVYDYRIETGQISWYGAVAATTGYSEEEIAAMDITSWEEHIHPDHRRNALDVLNEAMETGESYTIEYRFRRKDGDYRWVEDNGVFLKDGGDKSMRMLGTMKDIEDLSRRRESEELLHKYEQIVSASQDFMALVNRN